ncbi:MAG TPA: hypothetical protein VGP07_18605 [Polyangia bacterium]|jgi:hypothetical protein
MTVKKDSTPATTASSSGPVSDYLVERLAVGDLPAARAAAVRDRLAGEAQGASRLAQVAASNHEILAAHPPAVAAEEIRRRLARPARTARRRGWLSVLAPSAVLAATGLILVIRAGHQTNGAPAMGGTARATDDGDTLKGLKPTLGLFRKQAGGVERLRDGAVTRAGDELQVVYVAAGHKFGAVVSVDGGGHVTFHLPNAAGPAARLRTDGEVALPAAYELDAAPGFERFLFVVGDEPFDASSLGDVARGVTAPPAGKVTASFTVRKP